MKRITLTVNWIHVSESLPQPGDAVLVAWTDEGVGRLLSAVIYSRDAFYGVDYWMALPVLPEDVVLED